MHLEIEQKFRCSNHEPVHAGLVDLRAAAGDAIVQVDHYYNHPARDFASTDEALRIRAVDDCNYLTYKGPKFDKDTKSRAEEEARLGDGPGVLATCDQILRYLSFTPVAAIRKRRQPYYFDLDGCSVEVALDEVQGVGKFVEIEVGVEVSREDDPRITFAKDVIARVARQLGLKDAERRSYLELFLANPS